MRASRWVFGRLNPLLARDDLNLGGGGHGAGFTDQDSKPAAVAQPPATQPRPPLDARLVVWNGNPRRNREPEVQHDIQHGDGAGTAG